MNEIPSAGKGRRLKGQFFLLSAFFLLLMFYLGVSAFLAPSFARPDMRSEVSELFENLEGEFPRVANAGLNASNAAADLADFSAIAVNATGARGAELRILWIFAVNSGDDVNVTIGNFIGGALNVTLNLSGDSRTLEVGGNEIASSLFASPPSEFSLRANFNTTEKNLLLEKYKASLYTYMALRKGNDLIAGETTS